MTCWRVYVDFESNCIFLVSNIQGRKDLIVSRKLSVTVGSISGQVRPFFFVNDVEKMTATLSDNCSNSIAFAIAVITGDHICIAQCFEQLFDIPDCILSAFHRTYTF